jgi:predicted NUDIX family phosphoesterase
MNILAFPRATVEPWLQKRSQAFNPDCLPTAPCYRPRPELECDPDFVQLIAYAILRHSDGSVWAYQRTGGDQRLRGRKSVGVGGHVDEADAQADIVSSARTALLRELNEELQMPPPTIPKYPIGWINEQASAVGRVHIGLVWDIPWPDDVRPPQPAAGEALAGIGFLPVNAISEMQGFELWSELACHLTQ